MSAAAELEPRFVDVLPPKLDDGVLYVSMVFNTVVHHCCCGCGTRVVTPLSPAGWQLQYDGRAVTLNSSIGNHQYGCRSHYWIRQNRVVWSYACTTTEIEESRAATQRARRTWYDGAPPVPKSVNPPMSRDSNYSWWSRLSARWREADRHVD